MDGIVEILGLLNTISPLGIAALLGVVIFMLVKNQKDANEKYETVTSNHLHELPDIAANIAKMAETTERNGETLQRIEVKLGEDLSYLKARLDNRQ